MNRRSYYLTLAMDLAAQRARLQELAGVTTSEALRRSIVDRDLLLLDRQIQEARASAQVL